MNNSYLNNKIVLKYCKDYYRIINEEFNESDIMSDKVIQIFQSYIFSLDVTLKESMKKVTLLNNCLVRYFDDREFRNSLNTLLIGLKISKKETNVMGFIASKMIEEYEKYLEGYTRNLYVPRWI